MIDLSEAFDWISQDLFIAKLQVKRLSFNKATFLSAYQEKPKNKMWKSIIILACLNFFFLPCHCESRALSIAIFSWTIIFSHSAKYDVSVSVKVTSWKNFSILANMSQIQLFTEFYEIVSSEPDKRSNYSMNFVTNL